jgi:hypothetical protein
MKKTPVPTPLLGLDMALIDVASSLAPVDAAPQQAPAHQLSSLPWTPALILVPHPSLALPLRVKRPRYH